MSDSVKKYKEMTEEGIADERSSEQKRQDTILELLTKATKADKLVEIQTRAEQVQKEFSSTSLLLGLQIACDEIL